MCQCKRLSSILITCDLCYNLSRHITRCKEAVWFFDHCLTDDSSVLKHIFQIDQITVVLFLCKIIWIMEMNDSLFMCFYNLFRKKYTLGKVFTYFSCHIISLRGVDHRVLIGIFLIDFFINVINQCKDPVICCIGLSCQFTFITVAHILLCHFIATHSHNSSLYHILNIFYMYSVSWFFYLSCNIICNCPDLEFIQFVNIINFFISCADCILDLFQIKADFLSISFDYFRLH